MRNLADKQVEENIARANRGFKTLAAYRLLPGVDPDLALLDLLTDLMHAADQDGDEVEDVVWMATANFEAEINGED